MDANLDKREEACAQSMIGKEKSTSFGFFFFVILVAHDFASELANRSDKTSVVEPRLAIAYMNVDEWVHRSMFL